MSWFKREPKPEEFLKPGDCECGHRRSSHKNGLGYCCVVEDDMKPGFVCACQVYIPDNDDDGGGPELPPTDPAAEELEKLYKK